MILYACVYTYCQDSISASRGRFKNRLGAPKSNQMRGLSPKNEPIRPRGLGCRGGASDFEAAHLVFQNIPFLRITFWCHPRISMMLLLLFSSMLVSLLLMRPATSLFLLEEGKHVNSVSLQRSINAVFGAG